MLRMKANYLWPGMFLVNIAPITSVLTDLRSYVGKVRLSESVRQTP